MAIVARQATLKHHVTTVLMTPFAFIGAAFFLRPLRLIAVAAILAGLILSGNVSIPDWATVEKNVIIFGSLAVFLGFLGTLLTIFDHIRFKGWADINDDEAAKTADEFADAVAKLNVEKANELLSPQAAAAATQIQALHNKLERSCNTATADALGTINHELFRKFVPELSDIDGSKSEKVAFVPMVDCERDDQKQLIGFKLVMESDRICDAHVVQIARPNVVS